MVQALPHESVVRIRLRQIVVLTALVQPALLILFLVASLIWTGGQVLRDQSAPYDQLAPFPVFPVPGWLLVVLAVLLVVATTAYSIGAQMLDARNVVGMLGPVVASSVAALFFLVARTVAGDPSLVIAFIVNLLALVPLVIVLIRFVPEYERRRKDDELPEGYV